MKKKILRGALVAIGLLSAAAMSAQFVSLSRCQAAYPCAFPFAVQYRPDPFLAGQYSRVPDSAISLRLPLKTPLVPQLDKRSSPDLEAVEAAVHKSLEMHPPTGAANMKPPAGKPELQPAPRKNP